MTIKQIAPKTIRMSSSPPPPSSSSNVRPVHKKGKGLLVTFSEGEIIGDLVGILVGRRKGKE